MKRDLKMKGNRIKRWTAVFLSLYMALSPMSPVSSVMTVHADAKNQDTAAAEAVLKETPAPEAVVGKEKDLGAAYGEPSNIEEDVTPFNSDTELEGEDIPNGACEASAWKWNQSGNGVFDICGLKAGQTEYHNDRENPIPPFEKIGIKTTYGWNGYRTFVGIAKENGDLPDAYNNRYAWQYNANTDGGVVDFGLKSLHKLDIELKVTVTPSPDNKYLLVDYYVFNQRGTQQTCYLGTGTDTQIDNDDGAICYKNDRGFHMVNRNNQITFDCVTNDAILAPIPPDTRYVGRYSAGMGDPGWPAAIFTGNDKTSSMDGQASGAYLDSGITYAWKLILEPYETVHRRVAFAARDSSYYVASPENGGSNTNDGTYSHPFATIEKALESIGNKKGYIYLMDDTFNLSTPIILNGNKQDITIASTDYNQEGHVVPPSSSDYINTLTASGTAFQVTGGGILRFTDITLDGGGIGKQVPMLLATKGRLEINSGATITNCKGTSEAVGSAIDVSAQGADEASLTLNRCTITGNTSPAGGKGAVHFSGSGVFTVDGAVTVKDNKIQGTETPSNVYLESGKKMTVAGNLEDTKPDNSKVTGSIGFTTADIPESSPGGVSTALNQEIAVAEPKGGSPVDTSPCTFTANFIPDNPAYYVAGGSASFPNDPPGNPQPPAGHDKWAVLKQSGYSINFVYRDADLGTSITRPADQPQLPTSKSYAAGAVVDPAISAPTIDNYTLSAVTTNPENPEPLVVSTVKNPPEANPPAPAFGTISGAMPGFDVTVIYDFEKNQSGITFDPMGGTPAPASLKGEAGAPVNATLPVVSRYGYNFLGWKLKDSEDNTPQALPDIFPNGTLAYEAMFEANQDIKFPYTVEYANQSGDITFYSKTEPSNPPDAAHPGRYVTEWLSEPAYQIHGYQWSRPDSGTTPEQFNFTGTAGSNENIGTFSTETATLGNFTGKMPAQAASVRFGYVVNPDEKSTLTIEYRSTNGTPVKDSETRSLPAESTITAEPPVISGYKCINGVYTAGAIGNKNPASPLTTGAQGTFNNETHVLQNGKMPNQNVTIEFTYQPTGEGYPLTIDYLDITSHDSSLKHLEGTNTTPYRTETPVGADADPAVHYAEPYGYTFQDRSLNPAPDPVTGLPISWADPSASPGGNYDFKGRMPNESATVTYRFTKDSSKWLTLTYKAGLHGTLVKDAAVSEDVGQNGSDFTAEVMKENGVHGYTLSQIQEKRLMPTPVPGDPGDPSSSQYYMFEGWFIDTDGDGVRNTALLPNGEDTEPLIKSTNKFSDSTAPNILTASFVESEGMWIDITLASNGQGTIDGVQSKKVHTTIDKKWSDIQTELPTQYVPREHYMLDTQNRWYAGSSDTVMAPNMKLKNNQTYSYRFLPDPEYFGTNARMPDAQPGLNNKGEGKIIVYTAYGKDPALQDYQYILTAPQDNGTVLAVLPGTRVGRVVFDHLYPGTRYWVYEAATKKTIGIDRPLSASIAPADPANADILSAPAKVLTPVVVDNYQINYDIKEDGKTTLTIEPADKDSDYAVLDGDNPVIEPGQEAAGGWKHPVGTPGTLRFTGLDYDIEYTVVARPKGKNEITAPSKKEDGSIIRTDLGAEPELQNCIIETLGGTISQVVSQEGPVTPPDGTDRYETAHQGDRVTISAPLTIPAANGSGSRHFRYWEALIGPDQKAGNLQGLDETASTAHFTMPGTNVVLRAVYEKETASPSNADVVSEMRGSKQGQLALAPQRIPDLKIELTTQLDRDLMAENGANIRYKVVYQKNAVKASESDAVKAREDLWQDDYPDGHRQAYETIFGLNITVERYVDGRRVERGTPSDATVRTYVQTGKDDSDMLDYRLYQVLIDEDGDMDLVPVAMEKSNEDNETVDPADTGGLFVFDGTIGERYVLVCSQAYRVKFINDTIPSGINESFRVRKGEAIGASFYQEQYEAVTGKMEDPARDDWTDPLTGIHYKHPRWSYKNTGSPLDPLDLDRLIRKKTLVYAWYENDKKEVDEGRDKLYEAIQHAIEVGEDHFLHPDEQDQVFGFINTAQYWLDKTDPVATKEELKAALEQLKQDMAEPEQKLAERYADYDHIQDSKPQGGSGGGGGGGGGSKKDPYGSGAPQNYQSPVNGTWETIPGENGRPPQRRFTLNGGEPIKNMWAQLGAPEGTVDPTGPGAAGPAGGQGWYHFDEQGNMQTGWLCDTDGKWYYLNTDAEGDAGRMQTGFRQTPGDPSTYYLDPATGAMAIGWREIDGKWYYFNPEGGNVYYYDPTLQQWLHSANAARPLGAMYKDEVTPDGYRVGPDGAWIH